MIVRFQRMFSLDSGSYQGSKRSVKKGGYLGAILGGAALGAAGGALLSVGDPKMKTPTAAGIGAIIGAGSGAIVNFMANIADESAFNTSRSGGYNSYSFLRSLDLYLNPQEEEAESTTSVSSSETDENGRTVSRTTTKKMVARPRRDTEGVIFSVDEDPKKHLVSILFYGGNCALFINKANPREINTIDRVLDRYCYEYRNADYIAEKAGQGTYFVDVKLLAGLEPAIGFLLINAGIKINVITGQRFGIKMR